jgi:hypothetical protein
VYAQRDDGSCAVERLVQNPPTADEEPRNRVVVRSGHLLTYGRYTVCVSTEHH